MAKKETRFSLWIQDLSKRYRRSQVKAAIKVNTEMLKFYWSLGKDIVAMKAENRWGNKFFTNLSRDLKELNPVATCFSKTNLLYMKNFYLLSQEMFEFAPQLVEQIKRDMFSIPIELGTGFAYVGKEYRLQIGKKEKFIDLLFYNLKLSCYIVIEVKIGEFDFTDMGQLSGYVVACNHILRKEGRDNPTIGLLICKKKDKLLAQYALEGSNLPIGISEYDLERLYPEKVEGTIPTIEEIEAKLSKK